MAWSLSQNVYAIQDDSANNRRLYRTDVYLNWNQYQMYSGGNAANGGGSVDGQGFSWTGPTSGGSTSAGSQVINTTDFWIYGDVNGYHGTVSASAWFDGGGGYAPGYITASASAAGFDYVRSPSTPGSVTAVVNSDKTITVTVAAVSSPAGTPTYYCAYSQNGGGYTGTASSTSNVFTFTGLTRGANYTFAGWAANSDGTSGTTTSSSVFLAAGGKRWAGSAFTPLSIFKRWTGSAFVDVTINKRWTGTAWQDVS
jgi:hypothetical protein